MKTTYGWQESYQAAVLETDWTKMQERLQAAESAIRERHLVLSQGDGGTPEERHALAEALNSLTILRRDAALWLDRQNLQQSQNSAEAE